MKLVELAFPAAATDATRGRARALCEALGKTRRRGPRPPGLRRQPPALPLPLQRRRLPGGDRHGARGRRPVHDARRRAPDGPARAAGLRRPRRRRWRSATRSAPRCPQRLRALVAEGALGRKSGRGLYNVLTMRVYRIPYSTNVERVALALAHKSIPVDWVDVDPDDRSAVVALSRPGPRAGARGRPRRGRGRLDARSCAGWRSAGPIRRCGRPAPGAAPRSTSSSSGSTASGSSRPTRWPPSSPARSPTSTACTTCSAELRGWLHLFEGLLDGRDWLMGESFGAADVCAFPFLKYGVLELRSDDSRPVPPRAGRAPADRRRVPRDRGLGAPRRRASARLR